VPRVLQVFHDLVKRVNKRSYVGVGKLTYREDGGRLLTDRTSAQERALFTKRALRLLFAGKDLVEHHQLVHYIRMFS
jgi:hypothetical protein